MQPDCDIRVVATTFPNESTAAAAIHSLLREHLIACGTMQPGCRSIYIWDGKLEDTDEVSVLLKTSASTLDSLEKRLHELHPFDLPEFLVMSAASASQAYNAWVNESCKSF